MKMLKTSRLCTALLLSTLLAACGGGGSSGSTPLNVSAGVYSGTVDGAQWLTVLLPDSGSTNWYSLHYPASNSDLYSGKFTGVGTSAPTASFPNLSDFPYSTTTVRTGSGSLSAPTATQLNLNLNFPSQGSVGEKSVSTTLLKVSTSGSSNDLEGTWRGTLFYGYGTSGDKSITVSQGVFSPAFGFHQITDPNDNTKTINACVISNPVFTKLVSTDVFSLTFTLNTSTGCPFQESGTSTQNFSGIAFITASPKTLYFLAIKANGKGFSFSGSPSP